MKRRNRFIVSIQTDEVFGFNYRDNDPEEMRRELQRILNDMLGHYDPEVTYVDTVDENSKVEL